MKRLFTQVFLGMGIACLGLSTRTNAQSLLISNSIEQPRDNSDEFLRQWYIYSKVPSFCDSTGRCYQYLSSVNYIPNTYRSINQVDTAVMQSLKNLLIEKFRNQIQEINKHRNEFNKLLDSLQSNQAYLYYKLNNMSIVIDTSYSVSDKAQLFDTLAELAGDLHAFKMKLDHIHQEVFAFNDEVLNATLDTNRLIKQVNDIRNNDLSNIRKFYIVKKSIDSLFIEPRRLAPRLTTELLSLKKLFIFNLLERWNKKVVQKYFNKKKSPPAQETEFGALPSLNSVLGTRQLVPNIDIHGSTKFDTLISKYAELRFFTGSMTSNDVSSIKNLFFTETSTWGLSGKFTWGFVSMSKRDDTKRAGLNLEAHYLVKKIKFDTLASSPTYSPGMFHFKAGIELLLIKNILSGYANINTLTLVDNLVGFSEKFGADKKDLYGFIDFGIKMLLSTSADKNTGFKFLVDFGGVINGGDVEYFTHSKDKIMPTIRLGFRKDLGF